MIKDRDLFPLFLWGNTAGGPLNKDSVKEDEREAVQTVCHLTARVNVEQVSSRSGQLSEVNLDPDTLADMVSIIVNKYTHKPSLLDIMEKYYEISVVRIKQTKKTFSTVPTTLTWTRTHMGELDFLGGE